MQRKLPNNIDLSVPSSFTPMFEREGRVRERGQRERERAEQEREGSARERRQSEREGRAREREQSEREERARERCCSLQNPHREISARPGGFTSMPGECTIERDTKRERF